MKSNGLKILLYFISVTHFLMHYTVASPSGMCLERNCHLLLNFYILQCIYVKDLVEMEASIIGTAQSTTHSTRHLSSKLVDGLGLDGQFHSNESGCATTRGENGEIQWFSVELDAPRIVTKVQIARRMDHTLTQGRNISITIGSSSEYDSNDPLCLPQIPDLMLHSGMVDYVCTGGPREGKYVKISSTAERHLSICEVKVFVRSDGSCGYNFHCY